jgi:hypothetical protein
MSESTRQVDVIGRPVEAVRGAVGSKRKVGRAESENEQQRPRLHCLMVELIDDFFAEYSPAPGGSDKVDTEKADEIIEAVAKTVAELTKMAFFASIWSSS